MRKVYLFSAVFLAASVILAWQSVAFVRGAQVSPIQCDDLIPNIKDAATYCATINGKHICYNSDLVIGLPFTAHFTTPKDRAPLRAFEEVYIIDTAGVAVLNLSEAKESRPVFGTLIGPVTAELEDDEIRCLRARDDIPSCEGAPPGLILRNDGKRAREVNIGPNMILVNGTAYIVADTSGDLSVFNLAGEVRVTADEYTVAIPEGHMLQEIDGACLADNPAILGEPAAQGTPDVAPPPFMPPSDENPIAIATDLPPKPNETPVPSCDYSIELDDTVVTQNFDPGQACLISFCGKSGEIVTMEMMSLSPDMDPWLELRGPDDRTVTYNDDIGSDNRNSLICNQELPVDGCYTIAARSYRYETAGPFSVAVTGGESGCTPPPPRCDVIARRGLNLRAGPSLDAAVIAALPRGAVLSPIAENADGEWIKVRTRGGLVGWVNAASDLLKCPGLVNMVTDVPTPPLADTPTSTPTDRPKKKETPTPRKPGVYTVP